MRKSLLAIVATGMAFTLAACGGETTDPTPEPADTAAQTEAPEATDDATEAETDTETEAPVDAAGMITIWADDTRTEVFQELGEQFEAETGVAVDVVQKPTGDIKDDFITQVPSGEGPDLIVTAHDALGDLIRNGVISPVELGETSDQFSDVSAAAFTYEGQLYGVPYGVENIGLVRNNELVTDTPETFDELIAQAQETGAEFPVLIQQGEGGDPYHMYPLQTSFGAPVFVTDENGDYTTELGMEGPEGIAFAEYIRQLADDGILNLNIGGDQAKQAFLDGDSPYMITGPWNTTEFVEAGLDIDVLPVPSAGGEPSAPFVGVQGLFLSSQSENALLANQFLDYVATEEVQTALYEARGLFPASVAAGEAVDDEILVGFGEAGELGQPMPSIPEMGAVWTYWGGAQVSIINGDAEPEAAWTTMIENIKGAF